MSISRELFNAETRRRIGDHSAFETFRSVFDGSQANFTATATTLMPPSTLN